MQRPNIIPNNNQSTSTRCIAMHRDSRARIRRGAMIRFSESLLERRGAQIAVVCVVAGGENSLHPSALRGHSSTLLALASAAAHLCHLRARHLYVSHGGYAHHGIRATLRVTDVTVKRSDNGIITISVTYFAGADNCATRRAKLSPRGSPAPNRSMESHRTYRRVRDASACADTCGSQLFANNGKIELTLFLSLSLCRTRHAKVS